MIAKANKLLALAFQVETGKDGKPVFDAYGRPTVTLDANGQPVPTDDPTSATAFSDYVGVLDTLVEVARLTGHGPLYIPLPGTPPH